MILQTNGFYKLSTSSLTDIKSSSIMTDRDFKRRVKAFWSVTMVTSGTSLGTLTLVPRENSRLREINPTQGHNNTAKCLKSG